MEQIESSHLHVDVAETFSPNQCRHGCPQKQIEWHYCNKFFCPLQWPLFSSLTIKWIACRQGATNASVWQPAPLLGYISASTSHLPTTTTPHPQNLPWILVSDHNIWQESVWVCWITQPVPDKATDCRYPSAPLRLSSLPLPLVDPRGNRTRLWIYDSRVFTSFVMNTLNFQCTLL